MTATQTETTISVSNDAVTEHVPDAQLAAYRRRQHAAGRFISASVMAGGGGYYVTTVEDRR